MLISADAEILSAWPRVEVHAEDLEAVWPGHSGRSGLTLDGGLSSHLLVGARGWD